MPIYRITRGQPARVDGVAPSAVVDNEVRGESFGEVVRRQQQQRAKKNPTAEQPSAVASSLMTADVETLGPTDSVAKATAMFKQHRFRHVPVIDDAGKLVGMLSDRDILRGIPNPEHSDRQLARRAQKVQELMSDELLTATADTPIREIARVMVAKRISAVPLIDDDGQLVGIVSTTDILEAVLRGGLG